MRTHRCTCGGLRMTVATGGELEAAEKVRLLSDDGSGDAPMTWRGSGGRGCDGGLGGVLHDDAAATAAAQFKKRAGGEKTLKPKLRRR